MVTGAPQDDERRSAPRVACPNLNIGLRPKGRLVGVTAQAIDFNRFGIAVHTTQPLPKERVVFLWLAHGRVRLDNLVAVVHNCVREGDVYRCGIRFRTGSELQLDQARTERLLVLLEAGLTGSGVTPP